MARKESVLMCRGMNSPLLKCIGTKKESEFYNNWNLWDGNKVCFCKDCLSRIYDTYYKQSQSDKVALYYTCMQINMPMIQEVYDSVSNKKDKNGKLIPVTFNKYVTELQKKVAKKLVWKDFSSTDVVLGAEQKIEMPEQQNLKVLEKIWGLQEDVDDYDFLEETFARYTDGIDFSNPQQEDLYKDLCRDRLILRKINDGRYKGEETIDKVQNRISRTMSTLKVDQFEKKKEKTDIEKILEKQIWEIENTEPAEVVDKNEYKDYLDIEKNWGKHILRAVKNLLVGSKDYPNITRDSIDE